MTKVILKIEGMSCSACSAALEKYLNKQAGVKASVNLVLALATIEYEDNVTMADLEKYIEDAGYKSLGLYEAGEPEKKQNRNLKIELIIIGILTGFIMYFKMTSMLQVKVSFKPSLLSIIMLTLSFPIFYLGRDIIKNGFKNALHKTPNMDTLITMGVLTSYIYSLYSIIMIFLGNLVYFDNLYFETIGMIIFFVKLGRFIDTKSKNKTKAALEELVQITPLKALLKVGKKEVEIGIDEVMENDILIAKPGMKFAVDGKITKGFGHIDESFLTGEARSSKKEVGSEVLAGSINLDGYIEYQALKIGKNSTISEIVRLVVEAFNTKMKMQRLADIVSSYFVPGVIIIAFLTFLCYLIFGNSFNTSFETFVTVLVVACPCALGLATPLAVVTSIGTFSRKGILIKDSETLEKINKVDTIVFDKTGTLTYGDLKIAEVINYSAEQDTSLLKKAASLEKKSTHPIASAFLNLFKEEDLLEVKDFENLEGLGLKGQLARETIYLGNRKLLENLKIKNKYLKDEKRLSSLGYSFVYLIIAGEVKALIGLADIKRAEAFEVVKELKHLGKDVIMLTGDNEETASLIAQKLQIEQVVASVRPKEKAFFIKKLAQEGHKVMMVGDGVNDAISLVESYVGVSIEGATDIATRSADVILMNDNLNLLLELLKGGKKTVKIIKENLFWAFFYNTLMIPIAIGLFKGLGFKLNPMFGSLAMTFSSLTVVLNSLRLKKL